MATLEEINEKYRLPEDADLIYVRGMDFLRSGDYREARAIFFEISEKQPNYPIILNAIGGTYRREGDFEQSAEYLLKAIKIAPDFAYAYNDLCTLLCEMGDIDTAAEYAQRSIGIIRNSPIPWNALGICFCYRGEIKRGLDHFLAAYNYDNSYLKAAYNIACCYSKLNECEKALQYLAISLDNPRRIEIAREDNDLYNICDLPEFAEILEEAKTRFLTSDDNEG